MKMVAKEIHGISEVQSVATDATVTDENGGKRNSWYCVKKSWISEVQSVIIRI